MIEREQNYIVDGNIPMQKCIQKCGFVYKGIIKILRDKLDNLRLAYEIVL